MLEHHAGTGFEVLATIISFLPDKAPVAVANDDEDGEEGAKIAQTPDILVEVLSGGDENAIDQVALLSQLSLQFRNALAASANGFSREESWKMKLPWPPKKRPKIIAGAQNGSIRFMWKLWRQPSYSLLTGMAFPIHLQL